LRKRHEEVDISTSASDTDQAEIRVQYGFVSSSSEEIAEEWRSLLSNGQEKEETSEQPSALQQSSSITSFSSRFRLKKENSTSSIASLSSDEQSPKRRKPKSKFKHKRTQTGGYARFYSDVMGITFLEIESADDLPPEKNVIRTGFDMDPFVIVTYGVSTFRTRAIRHSLKPVWNEKLYFHVKSSEENYKIKFAVYDKDKFTNNDFVASQEISISDIIQMMPTDTDTSAEHTPSEEIEHNMGRHTIPLKLAKPEKWQDDVHPTLTIRAKFVPYTEIRRMFWVALAKTCDDDNSNTMSRLEVQTMLETLCSNISESTLDRFWTENGKEPTEDLTMDELVKSLENFILAADEKSSHVDANTIIEAGSDLPVDPNNNKTVNPYFLPASDNDEDEDQNNIDDASDGNDGDDDISQDDDFINSSEYDDGDDVDLTNSDSTISTSLQSPDEADYEALAEADGIQYINGPLKKLELQNDNDHETHSRRHTPEKVIRLNECPICHKPNLFKRGQMDIVTHVATCAANDWTTVDRFLLSNIGSEAQAQRR
jgi:phosphatidylserine decarboxylase